VRNFVILLKKDRFINPDYYITEIFGPLFRRTQLYHQDILAVKIYCRETGVHQIDAMTLQFPAKFSCGTAERLNVTVNFMLRMHSRVGFFFTIW
jgi:hypothetical protein